MSKKFRERILQGSGFSNVQFESEYAMKLMRQMGWKEGEGLGKQATGIVDCIQMKKRDDNMGIGYEKSEKFKWNNNWWENSYNNSIKKLDLDFHESGESEAEEVVDKKKKVDDDSSDSDEGEEHPNQNRLKRRKNRLNYIKKHHVHHIHHPAKELKKSKKGDDSSDSDSEEEIKEKVLPTSKKIRKEDD